VNIFELKSRENIKHQIELLLNFPFLKKGIISIHFSLFYRELYENLKMKPTLIHSADRPPRTDPSQQLRDPPESSGGVVHECLSIAY